MLALLKKPSAWLPVAISLVAFIFVIGYVLVVGAPPAPAVPHDEGAPARFFQLLMTLQGLIAAFFVVRWLPRFPKSGLMVLGLQILAALLALAPVFYFEL